MQEVQRRVKEKRIVQKDLFSFDEKDYLVRKAKPGEIKENANRQDD